MHALSQIKILLTLNWSPGASEAPHISAGNLWSQTVTDNIEIILLDP